MFSLERTLALAVLVAGSIGSVGSVDPVSAAGAAGARRLVDEAAADGSFSGVVLVARHGEVKFSAAVGLADRELGRANELATRFNIGGVQRLVTRAAIARLLQDGRLRLDERLSEVLPGDRSPLLELGDVEAAPEKLSAAYPNREFARRVTVRQLVEQSSGLTDYLGPRFFADPRAVDTLADYLRLFTDRPLAFEPGTAKNPSMASYIVLGRVIEARTGLTYDRAVEELVYRPAGMTATRLDPVVPGAADRAVGYTSTHFTLNGGTAARAAASVTSTLSPNTDLLPGRGSPAGGGYSSALDLLQLAEALRRHRILDPVWTDWVLDGFAVVSGEPSFGAAIEGGSPGLNAVLRLESDGTTLVVLANLDPPAATHLATKLIATLRTGT
jgi:CubicO group peptidase (beta-lactamase class C family)